MANKYEVFKYKESRDELFEFSSQITRYIKSKDIKNVLIVDRSSRPVYIGIIMCWRKFFPNDIMPNINFVNPKGFASLDSGRDIYDLNFEAWSKDDRAESHSEAREMSEITTDFQKVYKRLFNQKNDPLFVFDTCIHSGNTLFDVVRILKYHAFSNIIIGSVGPSRYDALVKSDFYISDSSEMGCYPFGRDRMIEKTLTSVLSLPTKNKDKKKDSMDLRKEIRNILTLYLKNS